MLVTPSQQLSLEELVLLAADAAHGERQRPRPREHVRVFDGRFVANRVGAVEAPALDYAERFAVEAAMRVEPRQVVEVGDVDDQRVAFPAPARVAVEQFDAGADVRPLVRGNDAVGVRPFVLNHHVAGCLADLQVPAVIAARHADQQAAVFRIDVLQLGRGLHVVQELRAPLGGPRLVRDAPVGRVDEDLFRQPEPLGAAALHPGVDGVAAAVLDAVRGVGGAAVPVALQVGVAVRRARQVLCGRGQSAGPAGGKGRQHDRDGDQGAVALTHRILSCICGRRVTCRPPARVRSRRNTRTPATGYPLPGGDRAACSSSRAA